MTDAAPKQEQVPPRGIRLDGNINVGNLVSFMVIAAGMLTWGLRLEGKVELQAAISALHSARIQILENKDISDTRDQTQLRESIAKIQAQIDSVLRGMNRIEQTIDTNNRWP